MAEIGQVKQFVGPFYNGEPVNTERMPCKIGISVDQKDYMQWFGPESDKGALVVQIDNADIQIGETFMYQPGEILQNPSISFPNGAPAGTKVDIIYLSQ